MGATPVWIVAYETDSASLTPDVHHVQVDFSVSESGFFYQDIFMTFETKLVCLRIVFLVRSDRERIVQVRTTGQCMRIVTVGAVLLGRRVNNLRRFESRDESSDPPLTQRDRSLMTSHAEAGWILLEKGVPGGVWVVAIRTDLMFPWLFRFHEVVALATESGDRLKE